MSSSIFDAGSDPLAVLGQDTTAQKQQLALYAIQSAAKYLQQNNNNGALKEFKKALVLDPQNTTAQTYIGNIYLAQGNNYEAIKAFKTLVQSQPNSVDAHVSLANAYLQDKQYPQSEKEFKAAAKLDPSNPLPNYTLALQYANTDRLPEAEALLLKVQRTNSNDGNVYYALGMVYNKEGKYDAAAKNLEKALKLKKNFPSANYELGVAYDALGRTSDAKKQLTILQSSDPAQAQELESIINKPAMLAMDTRQGGFYSILGPGTPLWMLDPTMLTKPNSGKNFSVTFQFNTAMDMTSVTNTQNWTISRANGGDGGYYNNTMPLKANEVALPLNPQSVVYNALTGEATITFRLNQNAKGNAVLDPQHVVFKFSGTDASGRQVDQASDEIDGFSFQPF